MLAKKICIVSNGCLSSGPRVEKEADALSAAGFDVTVIVVQSMGWMAAWDRALADAKPWKFRAVAAYWALGAHLPGLLVQRYLQKRARAQAGRGAVPHFGNLFCRAYGSLLKEACSVPADLYIAHNLGALPVAARAAQVNGTAYSFDAEDDHVNELGNPDSVEGRLRKAAEANYLPGARYVSAASSGIAESLAARYGIPLPTTIHNAFPWAARESIDGKKLDRRGEGLSLYWYSQTVGLTRGIQDAIRAMALVKGRCELHLRGTTDEETRVTLVRLASECGVAERIHFHPQVPPGELLSRTTEHDVGLALEHPWTVNAGLIATNKIFFYLLAGLAIVASRTPGQERIMSTCPDVGGIYPCGDAAALAKLLQQIVDSPETLRRQKAAALRAAERQWNWEKESRLLVDTVSAAITPARARTERRA